MHTRQTIWRMRCGGRTIQTTDREATALQWRQPGYVFVHQPARCSEGAHSVEVSVPLPWDAIKEDGT